MLRKLLFAGGLAASTALAAVPASARGYLSVSIGSGYPGYGYSNYGYQGYGYSPYGYPAYSSGYSPYGYNYPGYGYGYSYPSYSPGYSTYGYAYPSYGYRAYSCKPRRHHRDGYVWYTRGC